MWCASNRFQEVLGCGAASCGGLAILDFIMGVVPGRSDPMGMGVPIEYIVHGGTVSKEDAVVCIRVQGGAALGGLLGRDAGAKCQQAIESWSSSRIRLIWCDIQTRVKGAVVEPHSV